MQALVLMWRVGIEFGRAWLRSHSRPLFGDACASGRPTVRLQRLPVDARAGRSSKFAALRDTRTRAR